MRLFTLMEVYKAADLWYGSFDIDSCCRAECRLMRGERPKGWLD